MPAKDDWLRTGKKMTFSQYIPASSFTTINEATVREYRKLLDEQVKAEEAAEAQREAERKEREKHKKVFGIRKVKGGWAVVQVLPEVSVVLAEVTGKSVAENIKRKLE